MWLRGTWLLLVAIALLTALLPSLDFAGIIREGIPSDHLAAYEALAGQAFSSLQGQGPARYIRQLESAYALHELTFALLFLVILLVPFRKGQFWAWWACWIPLIGYVGYTVTFARFGSATFAYSLVPDIAVPLMLLAQLPRFRAGSSRT